MCVRACVCVNMCECVCVEACYRKREREGEEILNFKMLVVVSNPVRR